MDDEKAQAVHDVFRFLAELKQEGHAGDFLPELDRLIKGDALLDSPLEVFLGHKQGNPVGNGPHSGNNSLKAKSAIETGGDGGSRASSRAMMNRDRQTLFYFVMRMRESDEHERLAAEVGDKFAAYGWSCRARAYEEVYMELKAAGFGRKSGRRKNP